ncbi:MAG: hypothetical protein K8J31_04725 [Anaerolineae bacterium]|nr:hypothetical protein [Anaerolineae bacterium]
MTALILAGHGSHISPDTAGLVWSYVDQLRAWGVADEIAACFWKEAPGFRQVLNTVESDQIVIVPVFTARGYFSTRVIPAEMNLAGPVTQRGSRTITYASTIGEHPYLRQIIRQRVEDTLAAHRLDPALVAVAVIGHGTRRNPESRAATQQQTESLRQLNRVAEVVDVYLDDIPEIASVYTRTQSPVIIAVPFFLAPGSHVTIDVPHALGIDRAHRPALSHGRQVYYTPPVGTDDAICRLILELARDTGFDFHPSPAAQTWSGFPRSGARRLMNAVQRNHTLQFGQLELTPTEVRPLDLVEPAVPLHSPAALRRHVRENPFRPLVTSDDLRRDWHVPVAALHEVPAIVETIYPGSLADWAAHQAGTFAIESLETLSQRQTGMFRDMHRTPQAVIDQAVRTVCGRCVRHATWYYRHSPSSSIPCAAPCNGWLSTVKEAIAS